MTEPTCSDCFKPSLLGWAGVCRPCWDRHQAAYWAWWETAGSDDVFDLALAAGSGLTPHPPEPECSEEEQACWDGLRRDHDSRLMDEADARSCLSSPPEPTP